jgi:hypothetical protein
MRVIGLDDERLVGRRGTQSYPKVETVEAAFVAEVELLTE